MKINQKSIRRAGVLLAFLMTVTSLHAGSSREFLQQIQQADPNLQLQAVEKVVQLNNSVVLPLCRLMADTSRSVAQSAYFALEILANHRARPAAEAKARRQFNAEMLKFLTTDANAGAKQRCLRLVAFSAGKKTAKGLGKYLNDPELFEPVRWTLEAIPEPEAGEVLLKALKKAEPGQQAAIILTLGAKKYLPASKMLLKLAAGKNSQVRFAAFSALARLPEPTAGPVLLAAAETSAATERDLILQEAMMLAENLAQQNQTDAAVSLYQKMLELSTGKNITLGVIKGLGKDGTAEVVPALVQQLEVDCARTRQKAGVALVTLPDPAATNKLLEFYEAANSPGKQAALLKAIAVRDPERARPLVLAGISAPEVELKAAAIYSLSEVAAPDPIQTLETAIAGGPKAVRKAAYHACVKLADKILETEPESALKLYHLAIAEDADYFVQRDALRGVSKMGNPSSIEKLKPLLYKPLLSQAVASFYFRMAFLFADNQKFKEAEELTLLAMGVSQNEGMANSVLHKMKSMGFEQTDLAAKIGFLTKWWVAAPFSNKKRIAETTAYFPEKQIDFSQTETIGKLTASWKKVVIEEAYGILQLAEMYGRKKRAAYAYTELVVPEDQSAIFKIGSNDGIACWVNDEKVHQNFVGRGLTIDSDVVDVRLKKGVNRILCKVLNEGGNWQMTLRVCDEKGAPLDLTQFEVLPE